MIAAGLDPVAHSREVAVVGLAEVLRELPRIRKVFHNLLDAARERRPIGAVLIDFPDFNLRLARQLRALHIPVIYYVSPQIWAWRRGRVRSIAKCVDVMLVLFEFEVDFYREHGVQAVHVGHPIVEEVPASLKAPPARIVDGPARLALLPGSRNSEVRRLLPSLLEAAAQLHRRRSVEVQLIVAPTVAPELIESALRKAGDLGRRVQLVDEDRLSVVAEADLALCASGTATLEVGLLETPMIVVYRLASLTYQVAKRLVSVPHVGLVNLVLGREVAPELIQDEANALHIAARAEELLSSRQRRHEMQQELGRLRKLLGRAGASDRAAAKIAETLRLA